MPPSHAPRHLDITRSPGVLEVRFHSNGGPWTWNGRSAFEFSNLLHELEEDGETKVLVLTGTGEDFCAQSVEFDFSKLRYRDVWQGQQSMLSALLNLNIIVISVVHGKVFSHPEIPLLADIILADPGAEFAELGHFPRNMPPGDGAQLVMRSLLGPSRTNYFYLTAQSIKADEAVRLGFVHEILPRDELLTRARVLAADLAKRPASVLAYSKAVLRLKDRKDFRQDISHGMALEGLGIFASGVAAAEG